MVLVMSSCWDRPFFQESRAFGIREIFWNDSSIGITTAKSDVWAVGALCLDMLAPSCPDTRQRMRQPVSPSEDGKVVECHEYISFRVHALLYVILHV